MLKKVPHVIIYWNGQFTGVYVNLTASRADEFRVVWFWSRPFFEAGAKVKHGLYYLT